jgi:RimJ/RimL family protein N-acetyltransferase
VTTVRSITDTKDFALPGAPDQTDALIDMWEEGESRPDWCFVLEEEREVVGRVGFYVSPTCPPEFLGDLPPDELFLFGLWLPWDDDPVGAGLALISEALRRIAGDVPDRLQVRTNVEVYPEHAHRVALFDAFGMDLFQEKQGFTWVDDGSRVEVPDRLTFHTVDEVGHDHYRDVLAGVGEATLDRNDFYYRSHMDPQDWGSVYMTFLDDSVAPMWLLALLPDGEPVGFVAVSEFDEPDTATIAFIGVLPPHRGNGYIDGLLAAGTAVAQQHGFSSILSDVDTLNTPMMAAMERAGHHAGVRPWHIWHHVGSVGRLVSPA